MAREMRLYLVERQNGKMEEIVVREITEETKQDNTEQEYGGKNMDQKKLTKSQTNRMLCGVCAGLAEYFGIDPTVVRLLWVILTFCGGSGIIAYIIAAIIIPEV